MRKVNDRLFPVIGIGASAGGLEAFLELFRLLPPDTGMAFVLVQHLAPKHLSMLSAIVQKATRMAVKEVTDGMKVTPNCVFVIPPNSVLEIFHGVLYLKSLGNPHTTNTLINTFFKSLARDHCHLAVGIVLSGTGSDGSEGLRDIKAEGGISLVQEPKTAKYDGMPKMAIAVDSPDHILPVEGLVKVLVKIASNPFVPTILSTTEKKPKADAGRDLDKIFALIRSTCGTDFSLYKHPTVIRRIKRRMVLNRIENLKHYLSFLQNSSAEVRALFKDLLINVTEFFRDPEAFECLKTKIIPSILKEKLEGDSIRVWVPGCSSGEEAYSIAMCFLEALGDGVGKVPIQIYGTDIGEPIIKKARIGLYPESISAQVSEERLGKYFTKEPNGYRISRTVRDCCIFSIQDVTADPPIHRLDLLSCRNLMIYLDSKVQKKLMETFFYALNPRGYLMLGASESVGTAASLFSIADDQNKIYLKRASAPTSRVQSFRKPSQQQDGFENRLKGLKQSSPVKLAVTDPVILAESLVLEKYAPAWILVNQNLDVIHFKGRTESYIVHRSGQPSWNLVKMLREELIADVRVLLHLSEKQKKPERKSGIKLKIGKESYSVDVETVPLNPGEAGPHFLVLFYQHQLAKPKRKLPTLAEPDRLKLKEELSSTQKALRSFMEDQNSVNEELQSANEEVLSANEELQSTNEELETAKEELQSTNEELVTLNEELSNRNSELTQVNDDLSNFLGNAHVAIVMVNTDLKIRRLTPAAGKLLNLNESNVGHSLFEFNLGFSSDLLREKMNEVIHNVTPTELEVSTKTGRFYDVRMRPYKTTDRRIDGAVLTFVDIDEVKNKELVALATDQYSNAILETIHDPIIILDKALKVVRGNKAFFETFRTTPKATLGKAFYELGNRQWDVPEFKELIEDILPRKTEIREFRVSHNFEEIGQKTMLINARRLEWSEQDEIYILLAIRDISAVKNFYKIEE